MAIELWTSSRPIPGRTAQAARAREAEGWDGLTFSDSQSLSGDPYVAIANAVAATSRISVGTGVTNPCTRHPAVTAAAIASIQAESGNRAVLGIGRGDSSLAHLGLTPAPPAVLRDYLAALRVYLRGGDVPLADAAGSAVHRMNGRLPYADRPEVSSLRWLKNVPDPVPVPVFVVASGPRVIDIGARGADRVTLAVGADPERVRWGVALARQARPGVPVGAYVNVVVDQDVHRATTRAASRIALFARFSALHGTVYGPMAESSRAAVASIARSYQMTRHTLPDAAHGARVTPEFAQRFAILGPASYCVERLLELAALGVDRFHIVGATADRQAHRERLRFVRRVMPMLRAYG